MKMQHKRVSGFSTIIMIIILILVAAGLVAGGWVVYQNMNKHIVTTPGSNNPPTVVVPINEFDIPELGIKLVLPDGLTDLKYYIDNSIPGNPVAFLTTTTLEQMDGPSSECTAKNGAIGTIGIVPQDPNTVSEYGNVAASKLVGNGYVYYQQPQSPCTGNKSTGDFQLSQIQLLKETISTAVLDK